MNKSVDEGNLLNCEDLVTILGTISLIPHSFEMRVYSVFIFIYKEKN